MKYIEAALLSLFAVFAPIQAAITAAFALILVDLISGIWAARKRGETITSAGIKRTVGKVLLYESAICIGFLVETYLTKELFPACKIVAALVGVTELKSISENLSAITGSSVISTLLSKINSSDVTKK